MTTDNNTYSTDKEVKDLEVMLAVEFTPNGKSVTVYSIPQLAHFGPSRRLHLFANSVWKSSSSDKQYLTGTSLCGKVKVDKLVQLCIEQHKHSRCHACQQAYKQLIVQARQDARAAS